MTTKIYFPLFRGAASRSRVETFTIKTLYTIRTIRVYLPAGYNNGGNYPVLYLTDGQAYAGKVQSSFIQVGIDSVAETRWDELSPFQQWQMEKWFGLPSPEGGKGGQFLSYLLDVKKVIDGKYRTLPDREHTALGGASMGGLFAIWAGIKRHDVFSKVVAFSPAVWFGSRLIQSWLSNNNFIDYIKVNPVTDVDFWIYVGGRETHAHEASVTPMPDYPTIYVQGASKLKDMLGATLIYNATGTHFVKVFLAYFPQAYTWLGW